MAETAQLLQQLTTESDQAQEAQSKKPWERLEGESIFWYNRYKRFQGLGPKRTIRAALEQERRSIKALKSTEEEEKPKHKKRPRSSKAAASPLTEVQKPKPVLVPGSWKAACIRWHWVERAQAYDEDKLDRMVEAMFDDLYSGPALAFHRVLLLRNIFTTIHEDFNTNNARMTPDQKTAYYARMTALLRDIRDEMRTFDEPTQRLLMRHFAAKEYRDYKAPTTPEGFLQLVEQAGGMEALGKAIEQEQARRQELAQNRKAIERAMAFD